MQKLEVKEETKKHWVLDKWYEKAIYIFGMIYTGFVVIAFVYGFIDGMLNY